MAEEKRDSIKKAGNGSEYNTEIIPENHVENASEEDVKEASQRILEQNREAYNVLSK